MDYTLSIANIEFLKSEISKTGLTFSHLMDDLIDHVCCDVEYEMCNGLPFEKAYERVKQKIGMGGLERIQHETLYLIDKKYRTMKKIMKISGVVAPIILAFGALFKIEHWPGAGVMLVFGFFLLSFVFLPSAIYVNYKEVSNQSKKWTHVMGFLGTFFLSLSFLFKIQHWPGAGITMALGVILVCFIFLPILLVNKLREKEITTPKYVFVLAFIGLIIYLTAFLFKVMHWPGAGILMLSGGLLLVFIAFPIYVYKTYKQESNVTNSFIFIVVALVWFVVPITLMSLNLSTDVLKTTYETYGILEKDMNYIKERNSNLLEQLKDDPKAKSIDESARNLSSYINDIKVCLVKPVMQRANSKFAITSEKEINIKGVHEGSADGLYNQVLFKQSNKGKELSSMLQKFEQEVIDISPNSGYRSGVKKILAFEITPSENPADVLLQSLDKLSFMQLNVLLAEQKALNQLVMNKKLVVEK